MVRLLIYKWVYNLQARIRDNFLKIPKMLTLNLARSKIGNQAFERHANSALAYVLLHV